ncbi:hypothetical protein AAKU55_004059 [Oxalobacteraceae bacterium GrIS 1.11]
MLQQIVSHTPAYVWAILALLIWRGVAASGDRDIGVKQLCIMPALMLALSLQGLAGGFGMPSIWLAGAALGGALGWRLNARVAAYPARGVLMQPGSWTPLVLMLSIFALKFGVALTLSVAPAQQHAPGFAATVSALYGVFAGIFVGGPLRGLARYRRAAKRQGCAG